MELKPPCSVEHCPLRSRCQQAVPSVMRAVHPQLIGEWCHDYEPASILIAVLRNARWYPGCRLAGNVYNHPQRADGELIITSNVVGGYRDRQDHGYFQTLNRLYYVPPHDDMPMPYETDPCTE